jgi:hypothetical protein
MRGEGAGWWPGTSVYGGIADLLLATATCWATGVSASTPPKKNIGHLYAPGPGAHRYGRRKSRLGS